MDKGLKILLDCYWSSDGWKKAPEVSREDLDTAVREGYMFYDSNASIPHGEALERLAAAVEKTDPADVANAFLYSLSTRKLEYRSALGSYWYGAAVGKHDKDGDCNGKHCAICGWREQFDKNIENFKRYKFGGVNHDRADFALFDLEQFAKLPKVAPCDRDKEILIGILSCAQYLQDNDKAGKLRDRIIKERIYKTNRAETSLLLDILGICGVLSSEEFPCCFDRFADEYDRAPDEYKSDFSYPVNRWRKKDSINRACFKRVFGWEY